MTHPSLVGLALIMALPALAQRSQPILPFLSAQGLPSRADSVVLASTVADMLAADAARHSAFRPPVLDGPSRGEDRRWHDLVGRALTERHPNLLGAVVDSARAVRIRILEFVVSADVAAVRVSWGQCDARLLTGRFWGQNLTYHFARSPGTWVFVRRDRIMWGHGACRRPAPPVPTPRPPAGVRRTPPSVPPPSPPEFAHPWL